MSRQPSSILMWLVSTLLLTILLIPTPSDSATIAHWKFDEQPPGTNAIGANSILDSSGNSHHGTPFGFAGDYPVYRSDGMEFDGTYDGIYIPDSEQFKLTNSFTVEAFIKFHGGLTTKIIVGRYDNRPGLDPFVFGISGGNLFLQIQNSLVNIDDVVSPTRIDTNTRLHVAGTYNQSSGLLKLYLNGALIASKATTVVPLADLDPGMNPGLGIGCEQDPTMCGDGFDGIIDDLRISDVELQPSQLLYDEVAPTVSSTSPQDQATGIAVNSAIAVTFSELMDTTSITTSTFVVSDGISNITGDITFTTVADQTVATFTPTSSLSYSKTYTTTITTDVTDDSGNALAQDYVWTFTTGPVPDTTPPMVNATVPTNSSSGAGIGSTISVTFSELMDISTVTGATFVVTGGGGSVSGTIGFATSSGKTVATFTPSSPLEYATTYTGTVTTAVEDLAGNPMGQNYVWTFMTEAVPDTTPPTVISTVPDSNASGVSISAPITATFSEVMDQSSFNPTVFILTGGGSGVPCTVNVSGATATFTPSADLAYNTEYTATVTMVVEDLAGNPMASNHTWTFSTEAEPTTSASGGGGGGGCSVTPGNEANDQFPAGMILVLTLPLFVLFLRRKFR